MKEILCVSRKNRLLRRYFPKQKLNFPFSFQVKNVNINSSIRTNLKALYKEKVVY